MSTTVVEFENQDVIVVEMSGRGPIGPRGRQGEPGPAGPSEWGVIQGNISDQTDLQNALDAKANVGASYTKSEEDALLAQKADADSVYTKTETDSLLADKADTDDVYSKTEVNTLLSGKADADTVYTKTETDALLDAKADVGDSYTKAEEDTLLNAKANSADVYTKTETDTLLADKADADDVYTKTEVDDALADKADSADVYTKTETDTLLLTKAPVILNSASGSIASFTDGSPAPVTALSVSIEPVQTGTGDPSPDNVRPISGWTEAVVTRVGKNVLDWSSFYSKSQKTRCSATLLENGDINFTNTNSSNKGWFGCATTTVNNAMSPTNCYTIPARKGDTFTAQFLCSYYGVDKNNIVLEIASGIDANTPYTITNENVVKVAFRCLGTEIAAGTTGIIGKGQIERSSSATSYAPYQEQQVTIDLDGTRYGGTLNVLTGMLTVDRVIFARNSSTMNNSNNYPGWKNSGLNQYYSGLGSTVLFGALGNIFPLVDSSHQAIGYNSSSDQIFMRTQYWNKTQTEWIAEAIDIQIICPLVIGTKDFRFTVQLTPTQMQILLGTNNIWADTGDVAVEYRADTKLYIDGKFSQLQALILEN